jgi:hypothetical protein
MKKNIYVAAAVVILILISVFFIFEKNKSHQGKSLSDRNVQKIATTTPISTIATTTLATTRATSTSVALGWTTYVNQKEGFSIDYPTNFTFIEGAGGPSDFAIDFGDKGTVVPGQGIIEIGVSEMYKTFDKYFKDIQDPYKIDKRGKIDGNEAIFYSFTISDMYNFVKMVVIKHNNKFWTISTNSFNENFRKVPGGFAPGAMDNFLSESDYDRVINSFKFLK